MSGRTFIEQITDPVTGEQITLRAESEAELDALVADRFGITDAEEHPHSARGARSTGSP